MHFERHSSIAHRVARGAEISDQPNGSTHGVVDESQSNIYLPGIIDFGGDDAFASLARQRLLRGTRALSLALEAAGNDPHLFGVLWPELSVTRNIARWRDGIPYGFFVSWSEHGPPFVPISARPNGCGALVVRVPRVEPRELLARLKRFTFSDRFSAHDSGLKYEDLSSGNHFVAVGESPDEPESNFALLHFCPSSAKASGPGRHGLYPDRSPYYARHAAKISAEGLEFQYLSGTVADEYLAEFAIAEARSRTSRELVAAALFGDDIEILCNLTHQGVGTNYLHLGCSIDDHFGLILGNDSDGLSWMIEGGRTLGEFSGQMIDRPLPIASTLATKLICNHGLGVRWVEDGTARDFGDYIEMVPLQGPRQFFAHPGQCRFAYRDTAVAKKSLALLQPRRVLRIRSTMSLKP